MRIGLKKIALKKIDLTEAITAGIFGAGFCGLGIAGALLIPADTGDRLAFAGALIGSAMTVAGAAFAAKRLAAADEVATRELVKDMIVHIGHWTRRLQITGPDKPPHGEAEVADAWIDRVLITTPRMVRMLSEERLIPKMGRPRFMGAAMRFVSEMERLLPMLDQEAEERRKIKARSGEQHLPAWPLSDMLLQNIGQACARALLEMQGKGVKIPHEVSEETLIADLLAFRPRSITGAPLPSQR